MSAEHQTLPSPNPAERNLKVLVDEPSLASSPTLPVAGTAYDNNVWRSIIGDDYMQSFSGYIYTSQAPNVNTKTGQFGVLTFAPGKTPAQANVPFRITTEQKNHRWPPVLKMLKFIPVRQFPIVTGNFLTQGNLYAYRYLVREVYIPEATEGTKFTTYEYTSPIPFQIAQSPTPTPTAISYHYLNLRGGFPECLHKRIDLKKLISTYGSQGSSGSAAGLYEEISGQIFPATNFIDWVPYTLSDTQELVDGVWYRKKVRVSPPPPPEVITNTFGI